MQVVHCTTWGHHVYVLNENGATWYCSTTLDIVQHYSSYRRGDPTSPQIFPSLANLGYNLIALRTVHAESNLPSTLSASPLAFKISPEKSPCCGGMCAYWNRQANLKLCLYRWVISSQAWSPRAVEVERNLPGKPVTSLKQEQSGWYWHGFQGPREG